MPCQGRRAREASLADVRALRFAAAARPVRVFYIPNLVDGSKFGLECTYSSLSALLDWDIWNALGLTETGFVGLSSNYTELV